MANLGVDRDLVHVRAHALKPEAKVEVAGSPVDSEPTIVDCIPSCPRLLRFSWSSKACFNIRGNSSTGARSRACGKGRLFG
jgi:hypothetical protein